ncbi:hypothetical protein DBR11_14575 [Pedobacter sp. HMWF019]|nr:hypothetical protein DBR11_14575 [Pedobacter sp. HMWF019]
MRTSPIKCSIRKVRKIDILNNLKMIKLILHNNASKNENWTSVRKFFSCYPTAKWPVRIAAAYSQAQGVK